MSRIQVLLVAAFVGASVSIPAHAQDQLWEQEEANGVFFGVAVSMTEDVDGDGLDDVIVGDYQYSGGSGGAFVYSGATGDLVRSWVGPPGLNGLGRAVAGLGDVDGDGLGDVAVSAFWQNTSAGIYVGQVYAYSGGTGAVLWTQEGEGDQDYFGQRIAPLGDLSGDGTHELAVTSGFHDGPAGSDSGRIYVLDGITGDVLWTADGETADDHFGEGLGSAGDVDHDGVCDVAVGSPRHADFRGKLYVYSGSSGSLLYTTDGLFAGDLFGWAVAGIGERSPGGRPYLIVGSPGYDGAAGEDTGRVAVLAGRDGRPLGSLEGTDAGILLGQAVAGAGDVNQDREQDFLLGASHRRDRVTPGEAWLVSGRTLELLWRWEGDQDGDQFGLALDAGRDLDGDGLPDVVIGAYEDNTSQGQGRVAAFRGNDLYLEATPAEPNPGDTLRLQTRGGPRNAQATLYVVELGGVPVLLPVTSGRLDENGEWSFEVVVPPGLAGLDVRFQSVAQRGHRVFDSNAPLVGFR